MADDEETVEKAKSGRRDCEEIHRRNRFTVITQEELGPITSPVGPAHMFCVEAGPFAANLVAISLSVAMYPTVIETTSKAPTSFGGPGRGTSNHLHPTPMTNPRIMPATALIIPRLLERYATQGC
jgi:hypothetical protein